MYDKFSYIYDELMKRQVDYDLLASNVIQICDKYKIAVKNILECGMGSGNLTEKFLKRKIDVDGFDISDNMLSIAYNKLLDYNNVNIMKGDIRTFVSNEIELFLQNARKQMDKNSILMFDINSEYKLKEYLGNNTFVIEEDNIFYVWRNFLYKKYIDFEIDFFIKNKNNTYEKIKERQRQYIHSENDIVRLISKNKYEILEILDFETFKNKSENSYRILYVLKI